MSEPTSLDIYRKHDSEPFPNLRNLMGGWFHQDFDIDGPDLATIIPKFVNVSWRVDVEGAIDDIQNFLSIYGRDDKTLRGAVERILEPGIIIEGWEGLTTREWLLTVAELLAGSLNKRKETEI